MISSRSITTFGSYVIGGLAATITHIAVLAFLVEKYAVNPAVATSIGFCIAVFVNYSFQYYFTFNAKGAHVKVFTRYVVVTCVMLGVNLALFSLLTHLLQIPYLYAQLLATGVVMFCNYGINNVYTFKQR